jgi:hypothetical protein
MLKKVLFLLLAVLVIIQFIHPAKNVAAGPAAGNIAAVYPVPDEVAQLLGASCNDCHSNNTAYPWYTKIQPVDWWLTHHINEGKEELNFDAFATYNLRRQYHKMEEVIKQVKEDGMPLDSYTWIHKDALLNPAQKQTIIHWAAGIRLSMEQQYPTDSLVRKKD